jgi:hypothetical protein
VEASRPGELLNQDTFYWGTLEDVGRVCVQAVVESSARSLPKVYTSKMPITASELLYERVLPFYQVLGVESGRSCPTTEGSSGGSRPVTPTSCCWHSKASSIERPASVRREPTGLSSG